MRHIVVHVNVALDDDDPRTEGQIAARVQSSMDYIDALQPTEADRIHGQVVLVEEV